MRSYKCVFAAVALATAAPSVAAVVYSNDFDSENGGVSAEGYEGFNGLTVTYPLVNLVHTGDGSGLTCNGGAGGCVNLDGGFSGQIVSDTYSFGAGDRITLSFAASGSQRDRSPLDAAYYGFVFDQQTAGSFDFASTFGLTVSDLFDDTFLGLTVTAPYDLGFHDVTFSFVPTNSGTFRFLFDDYTAYYADDFDDDGAGRVIDDVKLDISAVPEPSTWATLILGFGILGMFMRRRQTATTPAPKCQRKPWLKLPERMTAFRRVV